MKNGILSTVAVVLLLLSACSTAPKEINFGSDMCHFCKMTIVDTQHAAQYVTSKGKQFKFDAIECMLNEFSDIQTENINTILVSDYSNPGKMTNGKTATYLISKEIKSPMGAFLSAFSNVTNANKFVLTTDDRLFNWKSINKKYSDK